MKIKNKTNQQMSTELENSPRVFFFNYNWEGINKHGQRVKGQTSAANKKRLHSQLQEKNILLTKITHSQFFFYFNFKKIKSKQIVAFFRQLAILLTVKINLTQALTIIGNNEKKDPTHELAAQLNIHLHNGLSLSQAFQQFPKYFSHTDCALIAAGEQSGTLDKVIQQIAHHQEKNYELKVKIYKAIHYPVIIILVSLLVSVGLITFIIPQFENIFSSFNTELPMFTKILIQVSNWLHQFGLWILICIVIIIFLAVFLIKRNRYLVLLFDKIILRLPLFGNLIHTAIIARWSQTLATLLNANLPLLNAITTSESIISNGVYRQAISSISKSINLGTTLETAMQRCQLFPTAIVHMIGVGEHAGSLPTIFNKLSEQYQIELDLTLNQLIKLLEPLLILFLAGITGCLIIAMYLPIFRIGTAL